MVRFLFIIALVMNGQVMAATVVPDRPGFSTGTYTVKPGTWQLEMGVQNTYGRNVGDPDSYTAPLLNLRTGLTRGLELNLLWDGVRVVKSKERDVSYVMFGLKKGLLKSELYNLSVLGYISIQEGRMAPFIGLLWDRQLNRSTGMFGTIQLVQIIENGERKTNFQPAIGINIGHTDRLSSYFELYFDHPLNGGKTATVFSTGMAWLMRKHLQFDINMGISIDNRAEDFIGLGMAVAF